MGILTPAVIFSTLVVAVRIFMTVRRRIGLGYDSWLILVSLVRIEPMNTVKCIDRELTCRPFKVLLWGSYIIDILLVNLGGLGRPLAVNMAIDKNRLTICLKVTLLHPPAASKRYSTWSEAHLSNI